MPFTPFHLGPAVLFGFVLLRYLDLPTLIVASVLVDLELLAVLVFGLPGPLHGFFHSFLGAFVAAALLAGVMLRVRGFLEPVYVFLRLGEDRRSQRFLVAALLGTWSHVLLDAPLYRDLRPFIPLGGNPLLGVDLYLGLGVYLFCLLSGVVGVALFLSRFLWAQGSACAAKGDRDWGSYLLELYARAHEQRQDCAILQTRLQPTLARASLKSKSL